METTIKLSKRVKEILDIHKEKLKLNSYNQLLILIINATNFDKLENPFEKKLNKLDEKKETKRDDRYDKDNSGTN